jgi:ATP-dependent Clp protease ATP-binding subunit ClpA
MSNHSIKKDLAFYRSAIALDKYVLFGRYRKVITKTLFILSALLGLIFLVLFYISTSGFNVIFNRLPISESSLTFLEKWQGILVYTNPLLGLFFVLLAILLAHSMLLWFFNSRYYEGIEAVLSEGVETKKRKITYEVAQIISGKSESLTQNFIDSKLGRLIMARSGVSNEAILNYKAINLKSILEEFIKPEEGKYFTVDMLASHIYTADADFSKFLFSHGVTKETYDSAINWVLSSVYRAKYAERWWSKDKLGRVRGIGTDWAYGGAYSLDKYAKDPSSMDSSAGIGNSTDYMEDKVTQLETILTRSREANALLIGEEGIGTMDIVIELAKSIRQGKALPPLIGKVVRVFDNALFMASHGKKEEFELAFAKLLKETNKAGNVILVIDNFPSFLGSASAIGSDLIDLMNPYFTSSDMHIVALSGTSSFHKVLESEPVIIEKFEKITVHGMNLKTTIQILEGAAEVYEWKNGMFFTYKAIQAVAESADQYITYGVMPDKAIDLLSEIVSIALSEDIKFVDKKVVLRYVQKKTKVPVGEVGKDERKKLLNLEEVLHKYVVGQEEAIKTISNAVRKSRAGIQNPERPLGSFLFLGPTGVGKTETAKALARVFFDSPENIMRLDMSEYNTSDSLDRLIGSFEDGKTGVLANMLKERPYGVLLLDEFEKATQDVKQLFLQILDEGFFSDAKGKKVMTRNIIIVATSNAGSKLIWQYMKDGEKLGDKKRMIIDSIVEEGVFKPELINRFDGTVIFHPLSKEQITKIAKIMLDNLKERIKKRGFDLIINDAILNHSASSGYDPQFGARPMRRAIQEEIEKRIADKILQGDLKTGSTIEFTEADFGA